MTIRDDGETINIFEPLMVAVDAPVNADLQDLALELATRSTALRSSLSPPVAAALADLVRSMNCYYSNLIEGHNTHPIDIERAIHEDYATDQKKRNLQLEAKAHIDVQQWIDEGGLTEHPTAPTSLLEMHRRFCELLPEDLLFVDNPDTGERMPVVPGELRTRHIKVGRHIAISPAAVPRFLERMHEVYSTSGHIQSILAVACAHHRLVWVHPFLDGNGRVSRLMSHAMLRKTLDTDGLWSVARGLARQEATYKSHLASCDSPRRGDIERCGGINTNSRGVLSEAALADFVKFFLRTCIDQVTFMASLIQPQNLHDRILTWANEQMRATALPPKSDQLLQAILYQGQLERGRAAPLLGVSERTARRIISALLAAGALSSATTRTPLQLAFSARHAGRWLPGLFPDRPEH